MYLAHPAILFVVFARVSECNMACVYAITNTINGKQYVGVTKFPLEKRFNEHRRDANKHNMKHRPLYSDMNEYGHDNFIIEELEECDDSVRFKRESYWIDKLDTLNNGYNETYGGTGKRFYNYDKIANKYLELGKINSVCEFYNCDYDTVKAACEYCGIEIISSMKQNKIFNGKQVAMIDINNGAILNTFDSINDAGRYIGGEEKSKHISEVCNGKRKTAYGYRWELQ